MGSKVRLPEFARAKSALKRTTKLLVNGRSRRQRGLVSVLLQDAPTAAAAARRFGLGGGRRVTLGHVPLRRFAFARLAGRQRRARGGRRLALREGVLPLRLGGRRGPARTGGLGARVGVAVVTAGGPAVRHGRDAVEIVGAAVAVVSLAGGDRLLLRGAAGGERVVPAARARALRRGLVAARRHAGGDGRGPGRRRGHVRRDRAPGRRRALGHVDDAVVLLRLLPHRQDRGLDPAGRDLGLRPLGRLVLDVGLGHRLGFGRQQRVDVVLLALTLGRGRRLVGRQQVVERLVLGSRGLVLLVAAVVLEQPVDELVVAVLDRRGRRRGGRGLELGRDLAGLAVLALARVLVGERRQRDLSAALVRLRGRVRLLLVAGRLSVSLFLLLGGLLGGGLVDGLRAGDLGELGVLAVVGAHHRLFPLHLLVDGAVAAVAGRLLSFALRIGCMRNR